MAGLYWGRSYRMVVHLDFDRAYLHRLKGLQGNGLSLARAVQSHPEERRASKPPAPLPARPEEAALTEPLAGY